MLAKTEVTDDQPSPSAHVGRLKIRHRQLDMQLSQTPAYRSDEQAMLKKRKLIIKDQIARLNGAASR